MFFGYEIKFDDENSQKSNIEYREKIETQTVNGCQIVAEIDNEDNSIDIAVKVDEESLVTLNISTDGDDVTIRKWVGFGDSVDENINIKDIDESNQDNKMTLWHPRRHNSR